ncbi:MAG: hypothetical protein E7254_07875 [Lachnospiraceae bacterium]|nr:hypothetical protein [Lachnospiraceae bacterium]
MTKKKMTGIILIFIVGFIFLVLDTPTKTGIEYPHAYKNDPNIIGEYQYYAINSIYGAKCTYKTIDELDTGLTDVSSAYVDANAQFVDKVFFDGVRVDTFNDMVGYLFVFIACFVLKKYKKFFSISCILNIVSLGLRVVVFALPFVLNGSILCNMAIAFRISYAVATILTMWFAIKGFIALSQDSCCRDERLWMNACWFTYTLMSLLVVFLKWLDLFNMAYFFIYGQVAVVIVLALILFRVEDFAVRNCQSK